MPLAALSVTPQYPSLSIDQGVQNLNSVIQIETKESDEDQQGRQGVHVCAVMDCSGSMNTDMKEYFAKSAIRKMIKRLGPSDTFHFVVYSHKATIVIEKGDLSQKELLIEKVNAISSDGATNISDGIQTACNVLLKHSFGNATVRRIFLFSDGQANRGVSTQEGLLQIAEQTAQLNVYITTFGIGSDFQEQVMRGIAEKGKGDYFFISSSDVIPSYVSKSTQGLTNLFGVSAKVRVQANPQFPVKIVQLATNVAQQQEQQSCLELDVGDLRSNSRKQYLLTLQVDPTAWKLQQPLTHDLVQLELSYLTSKEKHIVVQSKLSVDIVPTQQTPQETSTVKLFLLMQQVSKDETTMVSLMDSHQYEEASALGKTIIRELTIALPMDEKGNLKKSIDKLRKMVDNIQTNSVETRKQLHFHAYQNEQADDDLKDSPAYSPATPPPVENIPNTPIFPNPPPSEFEGVEQGGSMQDSMNCDDNSPST